MRARPAAGFALALVASGCWGRDGADTGRTLVVLAERDVEGLDPHASGGLFQTQSLLANVYEGLVAVDPAMKLVPALASSWTNPDDTTWDFDLRSGVRFQCGGTLEAEDVAFSLTRARDRPGSVLRAALADVTEIRTLPGGGVRLRTREPDASLLSRLRDVHVVSRRFVESRGEAGLGSAACGTGPYALAGRTPGVSVDLVRFDGYWRGPAEVPKARFVARSYGDPDAKRFVPQGAAVLFSTRPGTELYGSARAEAVERGGQQLVMSYLSFDLRRTTTPGVRLPGGATGNPFLDPRVREAVSLALDRARLLRELADGAGFVPTQLVPPLVLGYAPSLPEPKSDPAAARALLKRAGFGGGFEVDLDVRELMARYGPPLAESLAAVGIRARVRAQPEKEFFDRVSRGESSLYVLRFSCRSGDAQEFFDKWVHSRDAGRGYGESNHSYDANPVPGLDREIEAARRELDFERRLEKLQGVMKRVMEARLAIPLLNMKSVFFLSRGYQWEPRADTFPLIHEIRAAAR